MTDPTPRRDVARSGPDGPELAAAVAASPVANGARGAISELRACAYLMSQGHYVYRCESPHAPFDLVAYKDGQCLRVEVKSVSRSSDDPENHAPTFGWPKNDEWDLLVVVDDDQNQVFCFDAATSKKDARNALRQHYGFDPLGFSPPRSCAHCGGVIPVALQRTAIYCSATCKADVFKQRRTAGHLSVARSVPQDNTEATLRGVARAQDATGARSAG